VFPPGVGLLGRGRQRQRQPAKPGKQAGKHQPAATSPDDRDDAPPKVGSLQNAADSASCCGPASWSTPFRPRPLNRTREL